MKIYLPSSLHLEELIKNNPPVGISGFAVAELALVLSQIIFVRAFSKERADDFGFVPLCAEILQSLTHKYRLYLDYAVRCNIIEENRQYIVSQSCRHFKFAPEYQTTITPLIDHGTGKPYTAKKRVRGEIDLPKNFSFIARPFKSGNLEIDSEAAEKFLAAQYQYYQMNPDKIPVNWKTGKLKNPVDQFNSGMLSIERIKEEDYNMTIPNAGGRLYTSITSMPAQLRNFLTYDGEFLTSIDVANAQAYILNGALRPPFYVCGTTFYDGDTIDYYKDECVKQGLDFEFNLTNVNKGLANQWYLDKATTTTFTMLADSFQRTDNQEFQQFWNLTVSGDFYKSLKYDLMNEVDLKYEDLSAIKIAVMIFLFSDNRYKNQSPAAAKKCLSKKFPRVYDLIHLLKRNEKEFLPKLLQSMEAEIILNRIARRILSERRSIPIFTIHDCIATTLPHVEYVKQVMCEEFTRCIGAPPHLKTEHYCPQNPKLLKLPFYQPL